MIKRVLVTGADGFIGSYISKCLFDKNIEILNISKGTGDLRYVNQSVLLSLSDRQGLIKAVKEFKPDAVIHMAAIASPVHNDPSEIYNVNVCGTENILEAIKAACPNGTRVILFSTAGVYGNQNREFFEETAPFSPVSHYASSKAIMEYLSHNFDDCMDIRVVRPFNIIGKGQSEAFIVPKLVKAFKTCVNEISLGNMAAVRDYVSVEFCAQATVEYLFNETIDYRVMNICSGIGVSVEEIISKLVQITGFSPKIAISDQIVRHNEVWHLVGDTKRIDEVMQSRKSPNLESILIQMLGS